MHVGQPGTANGSGSWSRTWKDDICEVPTVLTIEAGHGLMRRHVLAGVLKAGIRRGGAEDERGPAQPEPAAEHQRSAAARQRHPLAKRRRPSAW